MAEAKSATAPRRLAVGERFAWNDLAPIARLLPEPVREHASLLFAELEHLEIGPSFRDFRPAAAYVEAGREMQKAVRLVEGGELEGFVAGAPFRWREGDSRDDPEAGLRLAWNALLAWEGDGAGGRFRIVHEDEGAPIADPVEGTWKKVWLSHRTEPGLRAANAGMLFPGEKRRFAYVIEVEDRRRGYFRTVHYRYLPGAFGVLQPARASDTWAYLPTLRRAVRWRSPLLSKPILDFEVVLEDLPDFPLHLGVHRFRCVGSAVLIAPFSATPARGSDPSAPVLRFEARRTVALEARPRVKEAPYATRTFHLDLETMRVLYRVDRDTRGRATRVAAHAYLWSGDDPQAAGWPGVAEPRTLLPLRSVVVHVETGARKRTDFLDVRADPLPSRAAIRRRIALLPGCVAAGTPIATPGGPRAVEDLAPGDLVLAFDLARQSAVAAPIAAVSSRPATRTLAFEGGLRVTPDHPLFASGRWVEAGEVGPEDWLLRPDGGRVRAGRPQTLVEPVAVYDLTVDGPSNFFAGGRLVHNKSR